MKHVRGISRLAVKAVAAGAVMIAAALPLVAAGAASAATGPTITNAYTVGSGATFTPTRASVTYEENPAYLANGGYVSVIASGYSYWPALTDFTDGFNFYESQAAVTLGTSALQVPLSAPISVAGSAGPLTVSNLPALVISYTASSGVLSASTNAGPTVTIPSGTMISGTGIPAGDYLTATANLIHTSSALSLAIPLASGTSSVSGVTYTTGTQNPPPPSFGPNGASATIYVAGSGFAGSGTVTFSTDAPGVTFTNAQESSSTLLSATLTTSSASTPGYYSLTITDANGTATLANAFYIDAAPTIASIAPATMPSNQVNATVTVTGTGFLSGATGEIVNAANVSIGTLSYASSTTMTGTVNTTGASGFYGVSITNGDGAPASSSTVGITVTGPTITSVSPSSVAIPAAGSGSATTTLTLTGTGFQTGAYVTASALNGTSLGVTTVVSATSITVPLTVADANTTTLAGQLDLTIHNPDGSTFTFTGAVGVGVASLAAPVITSVSTLPTLAASGASASALISGSGFGPAGGAVTVAFSTAAGVDPDVTCANPPTVISDSSVSCIVTVVAGAYAGPHSVTVTPDGGTVSNSFANAVTVSGPVITAASPSTIPAAFVGTITLTGTGFTVGAATATETGAITAPTASCTTSTTCTVTNTDSNLTAGASVTIVLTDGSNIPTAFTISSVFAPAPAAVVYPDGTTTGATANVGQGATNVPVTITGSGFLPGLTVTSASGLVAFTVTAVTPTAITGTVTTTANATTTTLTVTNTTGGYGTVGFNVLANSAMTLSQSAFLAGAPAATVTITGAGFSSSTTVTASTALVTVGTVTYVSANSITVPISAAAMNGPSQIGASLTVTNANGGSQSAAITINPEPTVTGTYYVPTFSNNVQMIITGTGFQSGMTATSSNSDYTVVLGQTNPSSGTSVVSTAILVVSTTSNATSGTSSNVTFTNPDGGTVTFALNGGPRPNPKPTFKVTAVHGHALTGRTTKLYILGTGFYGRPKVTSNAAGTKALVVKDNGKQLTVRVTVKAGTKKGVHTFTVKLANGQSARIRYIQR